MDSDVVSDSRSKGQAQQIGSAAVLARYRMHDLHKPFATPLYRWQWKAFEVRRIITFLCSSWMGYAVPATYGRL